MKKILVNSSEIIIESNMDFNAHISKFDKVFLLSDENVSKLYQNRVNYTDKYIIKPGEESKSLDVYNKVVLELIKKEYGRNDLIVSLGGGVVSDIAGFVASTFKRGMNYIAIPTSLLSMVDASIGGKNGVNFGDVKNSLGSFYSPSKVLIDIQLLDTLDKKEYKNGLAEIVKVAAISDSSLFNSILCEVNEETIIKAIEIKKSFVENDITDLDKRRILNFGHTIGHAIEVKSNFSVTHGEAVSIGMCMMTRFSEMMNLTVPHTIDLLENKLKELGLPTSIDYSLSELKPYILNDKKANGNEISIVYIQEIGKSNIKEIDIDLLK